MIYGRKTCECGTVYDSIHAQCPSCDAPEWCADFKPYNPRDWIYDIETYPNIFTFDAIHAATGQRILFEISDRVNQLYQLHQFLLALKRTDCRLIGFNNQGFDYPVIHYIINFFHLNPSVTDIYNRAMGIINTPWNRRFDNVVWDNDTHVTQIDLFKIHHFDNESRRTSLKLLEFNMKMDSIQDLPYPPGTHLNSPQKDELIHYNDHDVDATYDFYKYSVQLIEFREELSEKYNRNFLNHNDTKIGKDYFIMKLEEALPGSCYTQGQNGRQPRQTIRQQINLADVVFPYIKFEQPEFQRVKRWLESQVLTETKGVFTDLYATVNDFKYVFGVGGIHGSVDACIVRSDRFVFCMDLFTPGDTRGINIHGASL